MELDVKSSANPSPIRVVTWPLLERLDRVGANASWARGCDGAVLGCTEIPLLIDDGNSPLPTLDSTRLLARAAVRRAVT